jgi:hypothetical protein
VVYDGCLIDEVILMADNPEQTKPDLPGLVWLIPGLVAAGVLGYLAWMTRGRTSELGETVLFLFAVVPGSVLFLVVYAATIVRLRDSPRQRGTPVVVALATLAGLVFCALAFGLLMGAFMLEATLRAP